MPDLPPIIPRLKQLEAQGLKYEIAKEKLLSEGYDEETIDEAADNYQYAHHLTSAVPQKTEEYFEKHPKEAVADGQSVLKDQAAEEEAEENAKSTANILAGRSAPDAQSGIKYYWQFLHGNRRLAFGVVVIFALAGFCGHLTRSNNINDQYLGYGGLLVVILLSFIYVVFFSYRHK